MKEIFSSKIFKATAIFVVIVALVTTAVNVTIAFFTDAKESTGVFTAGNVYISLTEAAIKSDGNGNLIRDPDADRIQGSELGGTTDAVHDYGVVFPGQTIFKDPTVKNTGDNNAWVAIKVIIEQGAGCDLHELFGYNDDYDDINIKLLLDGGLLAESSYVGDWNGIPNACYNDKYVMLQVSNRSTGKYEFFFIMKNPMVKDEEVTVFDTFYVDPDFGNTEMAHLRNLKITVQAFAVQEFGFGSCMAAMTAAFPQYFVSYVPSEQQ